MLSTSFRSIEGFQRVLRATRWNDEAALKRAEETVAWRREFPADLPAERVSREGETGKELVFGYDNDCRPVLYMVSSSHTTLYEAVGSARRYSSRPVSAKVTGLTSATTCSRAAPVPPKHRDKRRPAPVRRLVPRADHRPRPSDRGPDRDALPLHRVGRRHAGTWALIRSDRLTFLLVQLRGEPKREAPADVDRTGQEGAFDSADLLLRA